MSSKNLCAMVLGILLFASCAALATDAVSTPIPAGSKIFIASMSDGFDQYMKDALKAKHVPLEVVNDRAQADFEMTGTSDSQKASTAKKIIFGSWHSNEQASISVANLKTGVVAYAYSANKHDSAHGKRSTAEACAKHLKEKIESGK